MSLDLDEIRSRGKITRDGFYHVVGAYYVVREADFDALVAEVERLREEVAGLRDVHAMMGAVAHADAHLAAMEDFAVTKERNGVVAFLHGQAEMAYDNSDAHHALCLAAESIERGEHRREKKP